MSEANQISEEVERRQSILFASILEAMNKCAGAGRGYVEIRDGLHATLVTRYTDPVGVSYDITQTVSMDYQGRPRT